MCRVCKGKGYGIKEDALKKCRKCLGLGILRRVVSMAPRVRSCILDEYLYKIKNKRKRYNLRHPDRKRAIEKRYRSVYDRGEKRKAYMREYMKKFRAQAQSS